MRSTSQSIWDKVPKRLITYWGRNAPMSWMRYMSVKSFISFNPEWVVEVLTPQYPVKGKGWNSKEFEVAYNGKDWFHALDALPGVKVKWIDFSIVASLLSSEVHRSDYIRYSELANGGVWSDMDVLYLKPIEDLEFSYVPGKGNGFEGAVCWRTKEGKNSHHVIGVLIGAEGSLFWAEVFDAAWNRIHEDKVFGYQHLGKDLLGEYFPWKEDGPMANIMERSIYPIKTGGLQRLYQAGSPPQVIRKAVGVHWYGGHFRSGQAQMDIVPGDASMFSQLARRSL